MGSEIMKGKPLSKEETKCLVGLIENNKIILSKTTNATINKLKAEEWVRLTKRFNATAAVHRRTPRQLRLKWENLKKSARKRCFNIRMNQIQTDGPLDYTPSDDVLDRVADVLGSTATGFIDKKPDISILGDGDGSGDGFIGGPAEVLPIHYDPGLKNSHSVPVSIDPGKRNAKTADDGKAARNIALAEYYIAKKHCVDAQLQNILLQNENLRLENEKLKLELERLKNKS
ncbi:hypothetical protein PYW07_002661 [Mythimna separata]|uniref:Regulatory protein zeste n=1 Tax=Mythimna separata TaxID=271217 RepID=A0AAD7YFP9_MYTSE|nr:hypothetical protein PYW07_002661 [Mythimna separata]